MTRPTAVTTRRVTTPPAVSAPETAVAPDPAPRSASAHQRFFATGHAQVVDEHDRVLWQTLQQQTEGGKRFRPALLTGLYAALGGTDHEVAARVGDAVELLHTAFVIHDDVIDGDGVRRGRPNITGTFTDRATASGAAAGPARHYGEAAGILAGDLALAGAVREIALCGARPTVVARLLDLLEEVLHRSAAGELADVRVSLSADASMVEALDIAEWKTAAYSFQLPMQAAAILAGADDEVVHALTQAGRALGIAFQLRDDLDGVFAPVEETGKDPLCDLREGKCTALIVAARSTPLWEQLETLVGDPDLSPQGAQRARDLLVVSGARDAVETHVGALRDAALASSAALPDRAAATMAAMTELLLVRSATLRPSDETVASAHESARGAA
ncbi:polyprenyl synthetase family protein [Ornithinimicrobium cryptoxanthini]|uniref:Polyprenyl synthetase family protein n=1 Tax=Ornithinimicrobium cryptoxanthini TaxID=2934161 RepID=A0ABY4YMW9_9MICO|nr:polyprenyl synthetase family protein [Ornithinimicrobium cryptoxanthini]USQ77944.1 polyprenyl synthetase family protein [Ornithinimicrobium cryptoxanthini]